MADQQGKGEPKLGIQKDDGGEGTGIEGVLLGLGGMGGSSAGSDSESS